MDDTALRIRTARLSDAPALLKIYAPYVEKTAITFECTVLDIDEFAARLRATLRRYPYLVAERGGEIVGYAYAGSFGSRAAYDWAVEMSIYLREDQRHRGTGKRLYAALEAVLRAQNIQNLYACIGCPDGADDAHLTRNSAQFHAHLGYRLVGEFPRCGYKFGTWYSMVWMEKCIGAHEAQPRIGHARHAGVRAVRDHFACRHALNQRRRALADERLVQPLDALLDAECR